MSDGEEAGETRDQAAEQAKWQGPVLFTFFMVAEGYLQPTGYGISLAQVRPRSSLTIPSKSHRLHPEETQAIRKERLVPTLTTVSPFVKGHFGNGIISE